MAHKLLDDSNIVAISEHVGSEGVPEGVAADAFSDASGIPWRHSGISWPEPRADRPRHSPGIDPHREVVLPFQAGFASPPGSTLNTLGWVHIDQVSFLSLDPAREGGYIP